MRRGTDELLEWEFVSQSGGFSASDAGSAPPAAGPVVSAADLRRLKAAIDAAAFSEVCCILECVPVLV